MSSYNNSYILRHAQELKDKVVHDMHRADDIFRVGIEIEACLLDNMGGPVNANPFITELNKTKHIIDHEYGSCQFEYKTHPTEMFRLCDLNTEIEEFMCDLDKAINDVTRNNNNEAIPVFLGANPSPDIFEKNLVTNKPRYKKLAKWQKSIPDVEIDGQKFESFKVATAIQGFHIHLQGRNPEFTAKMYNHILNIIPSMILLGANSRLLGGKLFSIYEPRLHLYDQSEQQNSGFPSVTKYPEEVNDYIDYVISRKSNIVAKNYFELEKERHDDVRIRLNSNNYRVETRILSVQPTPNAMMAFIEFIIGYVHQSILEEKNLRPLSSLREERIAVVRSGYNAKTHFNMLESAKNNLNYAIKGLSDLGIKPGFIQILEKRLENKTSPSEYIATMWDKIFNGNREQTVAEITRKIWDKTKKNEILV
ncbi:MAG: hypothetical protein DA328_02625 [Nitrososphaeraceae archaeon]|nr:hypothetical protein [Nitrososphaeraceae archaeon]